MCNVSTLKTCSLINHVCKSQDAVLISKCLTMTGLQNQKMLLLTVFEIGQLNIKQFLVVVRN